VSDASTAPVRRRGRGLVRRLLLAAAVFAAVIQIIPARRTNPPVRSDLHAPVEVKEILRRACYDCHSSETRWPWYAGIVPIRSLVVGHVEHGRIGEWSALSQHGSREPRPDDVRTSSRLLDCVALRRMLG
jgi:hypothetical protein